MRREHSLDELKREEARERILKAAAELFAQKGFDGTRISEIAELAEVNKALIYYYFENKQAILDSLLASVMSQLADISMEFVRECIIPMIDDGRLDIIKNRFHFASEARRRFSDEMLEHYAKAIDYMLSNEALDPHHGTRVPEGWKTPIQPISLSRAPRKAAREYNISNN